MISKSSKLFYLIEGINTFAVVYYTNYIFFFMKKEFGFGDFENLLLAALNGLVYMIGSWQGGKFAQKSGNIKAIKTGISGIIITLFFGLLVENIHLQLIVYVIYTLSVCLIWPALEAIISDEKGGNLSMQIGIYNVVWAGTAALAYFVTGYMIENLGMKSLFWFPLAVHIIQLFIVLPIAISNLDKERIVIECNRRDFQKIPPVYSRKFLYMAWVANPFSYVAISTVLPVIPSIAQKMNLTTALAGVVCSAWMFARLFTFFWLWKWDGWHYRFRWLSGGFIIMIISYVYLLLAKSIWILLLSQIGFGISTGIIYYSSLYYSMHGSQEKGAHGGLHEAMIGSGLFVGPAFGAACIYFLPSLASNGISVNTLLVGGFFSLAWMGRFRMKNKKTGKKY